MTSELETSDAPEDADLRILGYLEDAELKSIAWGLVDGGFADDELLDVLDDAADVLGDTRSAEEIRQQLESRALISKITSSAGSSWRTRMAETVRLLARLRQLFPPHMANQSWRTAATLVSDYRFVARHRLFPDRGVSSEEFLREALGDESGPVRDALEAMTRGERGWAPFQVRATKTILQHIGSAEPTATLVAAGTGSGKTKAVYLPALAHLSSLGTSKAWTKMVSLYPRNELLKDQLQVVIKELRLLKANVGIALTVGAFFGDTPFGNETPDNWKERNGHRTCPFLRCPTCDSDLYWFDDGGVGGLNCSKCSDRVLSDELLLSRRQQQGTPPDVLLTTVETLNRQLGNDYSRGLFGVGHPQGLRPSLLLLDEVHTYSGLTGAQVTHLVRRWRHAVGEPVHSVGLSATITDGATFFGDLTSTHPGNVEVVEPSASELHPEGKEYLIALRGNPASGTALLSTTIQTSMLLRRCLDRADKPVSNGAFGTKLFAFTDNLDVTNRFAHFLRRAEGQTDRGRPDPKRPQGSLANLRHRHYPDYRDRVDDGQAWDLCLDLHHTLDTTQVMSIERTSSQDAGFKKSADIVVATSSLEVGLDDDSVGAVIQHKAPRDAASFVQRRGRAGRTREMRPWTAVVLSDYGQDRMAFQAWDDLFDPQLRPLRLPTLNRYVLRIQATHALLDWLADQLRKGQAPKGSVWTDLTGPKSDGRLDGKENRRQRLLRVLVDLLDSTEMRNDFRQFLSKALLIGPTEVDQLLWAPPRGVLSTVVPTLIRRLQSEWNRASAATGDYDVHGTRLVPPLPDFLPSASFADLLLPEVEIVFPDPASNTEAMGVESALSEFSPGKVTHRFAVGWTGERLWIPVDSPDTNIEDVFDTDPLEVVTPDGESSPIRVLRPWRIHPVTPDVAVKSSSNGRPIWRSSFRQFGQPVERTTPNYMGLDDLVPNVEFFFHKAGTHLTVYRFSIGSTGVINRGQDREMFETRFVDEIGPVGIGYRIDTDAVCFEARDPGGWEAVGEDDPKLRQALLKDWFKHRVVEHPDLRGLASVFIRDWLAELSLAAIVEEAVAANSSLRKGVKNFKSRSVADMLDHVLKVVFQSVDPTKVTGAEAADEEVDVTKLHREIVEVASNPVVEKAIREATSELVKPTTQDFEAWLRDRYLSTVAGALAHALALLREEVSVDDLIVDTGPWVEGAATIRVSERKPGGVGLVEALYDAYADDPLRFWRLLTGVVDVSDSEVVDKALTRFTTLASTDTDIPTRLGNVRDARSHQDRVDRWRELIDALEEEGLFMTPSVQVALSTRFLRPGISSATDALLDELLCHWSSLERSLGIEIELRTFAHLISEDQRLDQSLGLSPPNDADPRTWRFNAFLSLLWPRGSWLRTRPVELWRSFQADAPSPDRSLLAQRLEVPDEAVQSEHDPEASELAAILEQSGVARVRGKPGTKELRDSVLRSLVVPVEVGVLELFPRVTGLRRTESGMSLELEVPEMMG